MECSLRALTVISLGFGLLATGALALAVCTDYWLYTTEPVKLDVLPPSELEAEEPEILPGEESFGGYGASLGEYPDIPFEEPGYSYDYANVDPELLDHLIEPPEMVIRVHSGLWRMCTIIEGMDYMDDIIPSPPSCAVINYLEQEWVRVQDAGTTWSILRAIRKASPAIVSSLLLLIIAFALSTLGNTKYDNKTVAGAVFYVMSSLLLAVGVILYISAVNDEVSHQKKPANPDSVQFDYHYGWAFFFAGGSFIGAMCAAVTNITLYLKRYPTLEDMVDIIPGLEKKGNFYKVSSEDEGLDFSTDSQNPTLIL